MLAWLGDLNARERRTMGACFGGWALDAFDVQIYSFVNPTVIALWGSIARRGRSERHHRPQMDFFVVGNRDVAHGYRLHAEIGASRRFASWIDWAAVEGEAGTALTLSCGRDDPNGS